MGTGTIVFAVLFLALPLAAFLVAWAVPAYAFLLAIVGVALLLTGVTLGAFVLPE